MKFCGRSFSYLPDASYGKKRPLDDIMEHAVRAYPRGHAQIVRSLHAARDIDIGLEYRFIAGSSLSSDRSPESS